MGYEECNNQKECLNEPLKTQNILLRKTKQKNWLCPESLQEIADTAKRGLAG